jgi:hypothetical protein
MTEVKERVIQDIVSRVLSAYDEIGSLVPEYNQNILLRDLTLGEYNALKEVEMGDVA